MAFPADIVVGEDTYSLITQRPSSSVRSDAAQDLTNPHLLTLSHESNRNGQVSSVAIFDIGAALPCDNTCGTAGSISNARAMFKIQYNPTEGNADLDIQLTSAIQSLLAWMGDSTNMDKFRNKES